MSRWFAFKLDNDPDQVQVDFEFEKGGIKWYGGPIILTAVSEEGLKKLLEE